MRYKITVALLLFCSVQKARACDVCGAASGNQNMGLLPQMHQHFVGTQYQYNGFNSQLVPLSENQTVKHVEGHYHTVQVWGRYCIGNRIELFGFLPYRYNISNYNNIGTLNKGLGDASFMFQYIFINNADSTSSKWKHRLQAGMGLKIPTGGYSGVSVMDNEGIPNMQPGSGSWDIPVNINYTLTRAQTGLNTDISFVATTPNKYVYKYGNRLNVQVLGFYKLQAKKLTVLPQAGIRYEYALHDYDNYTRKWLNEQTGGNIVSVVAGIQLYRGQAGLQLQYSKPVAQHFGGGNITAVQKIDAGLILLFNNNK